MTARKIEALRNLAERPGTEAEGRLAREILERIESKIPPLDDEWKYFERYLKTRDIDDLWRATRYQTCECGHRRAREVPTCPMTAKHIEIAGEIRLRFPRGTRVYYNCWAYTANCPAKVAGYSDSWNWIRLKFDHLKSVRAVPIYKRQWHLSTEPVSREASIQANLRDGMERMEAQ